MAESIEKIGVSEDPYFSVEDIKIELEDDTIIESQSKRIMVPVENHQPYNSASLTNNSDGSFEGQPRVYIVKAEIYKPCSSVLENLSDESESQSPAPIIKSESEQHLQAIKNEPQNNPDEILKVSSVPSANAIRVRNYRARQKKKYQLQNQSDKVRGVLPATEYMRQYRAKQREKMLQNKPDEILKLPLAPLTSTERSRICRARQKEKNQLQNQSDKVRAVLPATEYMRQYRAQQREKMLQNNPAEILELPPAPLTSTERSRICRARRKLNSMMKTTQKIAR